MTDKTLRAGLMTRVSTEGQADKGALAARVDACREYALGQGWTVVAEYPDAITGTSAIKDRPCGAQCYADARAGRLDAVVIDFIDRASRDEWGIEFLVFKRDMAACGVAVYFTDSGLSPADPYEGLGDYLKAISAGKDRKRILKNTHDGRMRRANNSHLSPNGRVPKFYAAVRGDTGKSIGYKLDPRWQATLNRMAKLFLARASYADIAHKIRVDPDGALMSAASARKYLENPFCRGYVRFTNQGRANVVRGAHQPVWDDPTCRAVEAELARRAARGRRYPRSFGVFSGLVFCGCCRRMMTTSNNDATWYQYKCPQREYARKNLTVTDPIHDHNSISENKLLAALVAFLDNTTPEQVAAYAASADAAAYPPDDGPGDVGLAAAALQAQVDELRKAAQDSSGIVRDTLVDKLRRMEGELSRLQDSTPPDDTTPDDPDTPPPAVTADAILGIGRTEMREIFRAHLWPIFVWQGQIVTPPQITR